MTLYTTLAQIKPTKLIPMTSIPIAGLVILGGLMAMATGCRPTEPILRGEALYVNCVACHAEDGSGHDGIQAPAIAGMSKWYLKRQIEKFRNGARGAHPQDIRGLKMRPMSRTLVDEEEIDVVAQYITAMKPLSFPATIEGGDAARGKTLYATCGACHGPKGAGMRSLNAPDLTHMQDWYLRNQLDNFKSGVRGSNPKDAQGALMAPMAKTLVDDQAVSDVIAYILTLRK